MAAYQVSDSTALKSGFKTQHEQRMEQLRRSTLERDRLNNEINELNSQNTHNKK